MAQVQVQDAHDWYRTLSLEARERAEVRLDILQKVERLQRRGFRKNIAVHRIAVQEGVSASAIWRWFQHVQGLSRRDWLPALANSPRHILTFKE